MVTDQGPKVLEFNVRFGDPETQPIMMRLKSDLSDLCDAAIDGALDQFEADWDSRVCLGVVMAAGGYPGKYQHGFKIEGMNDVIDAKVFHAGTAEKDQQTVTAGGRVLCVCALGDDVEKAQELTYTELKKISWPDCYYRTDIGYRAINRTKQS